MYDDENDSEGSQISRQLHHTPPVDEDHETWQKAQVGVRLL